MSETRDSSAVVEVCVVQMSVVSPQSMRDESSLRTEGRAGY